MPGIRKLCALSIGYCAAIFVSHYLLSGASLVSLLLLALTMVLFAFLFSGLNRRRLLIAAIAAAIGFTHYWLCSDFVINKCEVFAGKELTISARVTDYPDVRERCTLLNVRLTGDELPHVNALIADYSGAEQKLAPGDEISVKLKLRSVTERYGEETDSNTSKGILVYGYTSEGLTVTGRWQYSFLYFPKQIGNTLHSVIDSLFEADTAPFMKALLAGYKDDYYENDRLYSAMNMAGLAHVVAVSGMHVAFLVGVLQNIMGKNRRSSVLCIVLVWLFVVMVGSPPSAVRAGIMISLLLLAPLLERINDRATTLSFALLLILASNPFSAGSVALQLSFGAVAGMFLFSRPLYEYLSSIIPAPKFASSAVNYIVATLSSSLAVTVFTVPLMALHFGYVTLLAPVMNILCLWAISVLFTGGFAVCAAGLIFPAAGEFLASVISYLVRYIACVVEYAVKLPFTAVYMENTYVPIWLALSYLTFAVHLALRRRKKRSAFLPCALCAVMLLGVFALTERDMRNDTGTIGVMNVGNGQCIAMTEGENAVVIDCGSYGISENAGNMLSRYLHAGGHNTVDILMLTHLHSDHAQGAVRLMNLINVKMLILPDNAEDTNDSGVLEELVSTANDNGTRLVYITQDEDFTAGLLRLSIYESSELGSRSESGIMATVSIDDYDMLITGDVEMSVERELARKHDLSGTELLIVPHHGSRYSTSTQLLEAAAPELAVISTGYNSYVHPTQEVLDRLNSYGIEIMRTDELGRIIIHIPSGD